MRVVIGPIARAEICPRGRRPRSVDAVKLDLKGEIQGSNNSDTLISGFNLPYGIPSSEQFKKRMRTQVFLHPVLRNIILSSSPIIMSYSTMYIELLVSYVAGISLWGVVGFVRCSHSGCLIVVPIQMRRTA